MGWRCGGAGLAAATDRFGGPSGWGWASVSLDLRETAGRQAAHRRAAGIPRPCSRPVRRRLLLPLDRGRLHRRRRQGAVRPLHGRDRGVGVRRSPARGAGDLRAGRHGQALVRHRRPHHPAGKPLRDVRSHRLGRGRGPRRALPDLVEGSFPGPPRGPAPTQTAQRPRNWSISRRSRLVGRPAPRSRCGTDATSSRGGGGGVWSTKTSAATAAPTR